MGPVETVFLLGLVNWMSTELIVTSVIFAEPRNTIVRFAKRRELSESRTVKIFGSKLRYLTTCAFCVGIWVGFIQAIVFDGPLDPTGWLAWSAFIVNGLAYKAVGHLALQINAWFHASIALSKERRLQLRYENELHQIPGDITGGKMETRIPA